VFAASNVRLVAISTETPDQQRQGEERLEGRIGKLPFTFVSDPEGRSVDLLGIRHKSGGPDGQDIAQVVTLIVDRTGVIKWMQASESLRVRPKPDDVAREAGRIAREAPPPPGQPPTGPEGQPSPTRGSVPAAPGGPGG